MTAAIKSHIFRLLAVSLLQAADFEWPALTEIANVQQSALAGGPAPSTVVYDSSKSAFVVDLKTGHQSLWIPDTAVDLQQRLRVVAHAGIAGHRSVDATTAAIQRTAWWSTM